MNDASMSLEQYSHATFLNSVRAIAPVGTIICARVEWVQYVVMIVLAIVQWLISYFQDKGDDNEEEETEKFDPDDDTFSWLAELGLASGNGLLGILGLGGMLFPKAFSTIIKKLGDTLKPIIKPIAGALSSIGSSLLKSPLLLAALIAALAWWWFVYRKRDKKNEQTTVKVIAPSAPREKESRKKQPEPVETDEEVNEDSNPQRSKEEESSSPSPAETEEIIGSPTIVLPEVRSVAEAQVDEDGIPKYRAFHAPTDGEVSAFQSSYERRVSGSARVKSVIKQAAKPAAKIVRDVAREPVAEVVPTEEVVAISERPPRNEIDRERLTDVRPVLQNMLDKRAAERERADAAADLAKSRQFEIAKEKRAAKRDRNNQLANNLTSVAVAYAGKE